MTDQEDKANSGNFDFDGNNQEKNCLEIVVPDLWLSNLVSCCWISLKICDESTDWVKNVCSATRYI